MRSQNKTGHRHGHKYTTRTTPRLTLAKLAKDSVLVNIYQDLDSNYFQKIYPATATAEVEVEGNVEPNFSLAAKIWPKTAAASKYLL